MSLRLAAATTSLRDWRLDDLPIWRHWLLEPGRWKELDAPYYPLMPPEDVERMIAARRRTIESGTPPVPRRSLVIAAEDDHLIGTVTWYWESEHTLWPGIGIAIFDENEWGKGRGSEALGLWCEYLFRSLPPIVRLDLRTWSGNAGMIRLAEKLGFREEARFRQARLVDGRYYDALGYGILREEWEQRQGMRPDSSSSRRQPG
ncbi:MAG TPA: GNAT family protein [Chloroflexota bacterium]|nr:GNAT family protein [Chloroflexota bacterium]